MLRIHRLFVVYIFLMNIATGQTNHAAMDRQAVIEMIPTSHDLLDIQERGDLLKLISVVDEIYPILGDELLSTRNQKIQAYALAILGETKTKKDEILPFIREFLIRHREDNPQPDSVFTGIITLGKIGNTKDIEILSNFLKIGFESSRVVAARSIDQIRVREKIGTAESDLSERSLGTEVVPKPQETESSGDAANQAVSSKVVKTKMQQWDWMKWIVGLIVVFGGVGFLVRSKLRG